MGAKFYLNAKVRIFYKKIRTFARQNQKNQSQESRTKSQDFG